MQGKWRATGKQEYLSGYDHPEVLHWEMLDNIRKEVPLIPDYQPAEEEVPTNAQLYRIYIERYFAACRW